MAMLEVPGEPSDLAMGRTGLLPFIPEQPPACRPTFLLGLAFLHPVRHLPQRVEEEVSLLLADDLGAGEEAKGCTSQGRGFLGGPSWGHGHGGLCESAPIVLIALQMWRGV